MKIITDFLWRIVAFVVTLPLVREYLIGRAQLNPYNDIWSRDGSTIYMRRGWIANAYGKDAKGEQLPPRWPGLPSVRVHCILRADDDPHPHTHPWPARTILLKGWYLEERPEEYRGERLRREGDTMDMPADLCHRITNVSEGGVWTLFWTFGSSAGWGFKVDGEVVPWRTYLGVDD